MIKLTVAEKNALDTLDLDLPSTKQIKEAIQRGMSTYEFKPQRGGCGRAYVCVGVDYSAFCSADSKVLSKASKAIAKHVSEAATELGMRLQAKSYGVGDNALYIGYDNCDGKAWSQAVQVAKNLEELGIGAYEDGQGD